MRQFAASTHSGLKRNHNEDCYEADPALGLWLVADGVGGHSCGEVASNIVRATLKADIARGKSLLASIAHSHEAVLEEIQQREATRGMGSTVVALRIEDDKYELAWVGDSRAYLWDRQLQQLSRDHNRVSELLDRAIITEEQAATHPERHVLTQSLGVSKQMLLEPGHLQGILSRDQQILLCSDGLTDDVSDAAIAKLMADNHTPEAQVDALINAALGAGGSDNVTVVVVGSCAGESARAVTADLETTQNIGRTASSKDTPRANYPVKLGLLITAVALLALWFWL